MSIWASPHWRWASAEGHGMESSRTDVSVQRQIAGGVLVTGAGGFVGRQLCACLNESGIRVHALSRGPIDGISRIGVRVFDVGDVAAFRDWKAVMAGIDTVVHLAGRAHVLRESASDASLLYFHNNLDATKSVAQGAIKHGVRQFIFMSTVKVFGDHPVDGPLHPSHPTAPSDDYGRSKLEAEQWLLSLGPPQGLEVAIVRPPLVYGPEVRANFLRLMGWVERGIPLPLAGLGNRRSLVNVWNLNDLLLRLIERRGVAGGVWHVADGQDISTTSLIEEIARSMSKRARLFTAPKYLVRWLLSAAGRGSEYDRLFGSLQLDITDTMTNLEWRPAVSTPEGVERTVRWYLERSRRH
jgi:nucleoside-diphosphate-sugar epimerase